MSGLRRDQGVTRKEAPKVEIDESHGGLVKINPLVDWTNDEVWKYVKERNLPVNRLHVEGYPSVGCAPCSRAIQAGDELKQNDIKCTQV